MLTGFQYIARRLFLFVEAIFRKAFEDSRHPFYYLGAISFFLFWIIAVTGAYLFIFFESSINGAYGSVEYLTHEQWYLGGIMRSLHRYASDAMVITVTIHLLREFSLGRFRATRWYSWVSGVFLLWFVAMSGVTGYWLVWDELSQYIAIQTAEWADWLPIFVVPMARNFLNNAALSDRFFTLLVFMHIAIPLFLLFGMWFHMMRISRARSTPPRPLIIGILASLLVLSIVWPAYSRPQANLDQTVTTIQFDWFYLFIYPLIAKWSPKSVWLFAWLSTLALIILPWLPGKKRQPPAEVDLANCNGCGRCFEDCPYGAVVMMPRTDGLPYTEQAVVNPDICTSCGICAGACPTATPFRRQSEIAAGIDMPALPVSALRDQMIETAAALSGPARIVVFGCQGALESVNLAGSNIGIIALPCLGNMSPTYIDFLLSRKHADGVYLAGCAQGDCQHRFGVQWTQQRIAGERDPYLRARVPRERISAYWGGSINRRAIVKDLAAFQKRIEALGPIDRSDDA